MRIAYVINNTWFPGGQTRVLANKVNYWLRNGHEVYILTSDQIGKEPQTYESTAQPIPPDQGNIKKDASEKQSQEQINVHKEPPLQPLPS